jgi:hypothetical protein
MQGYVIFNSEAVFNTAHETAKVAAGLPKVGSVNGIPAPENQQTTEITSCTSHPTDGTVVAYINGEWPDNLKDGFAYKTREEISEYFPDEGA